MGRLTIYLREYGLKYMQNDYRVQQIRIYSCVYRARASGSVFRRVADKNARLPFGCILLKHVQKGYVLFDTGMDLKKPRSWGEKPEKLLNLLMERLVESGVEPSKIQNIIVSHVHSSNLNWIGGFNRYFLISTEENIKALSKKKRRDSQYRTVALSPSTNTFLNRYFSETYDVFRDDSIWMVGLNGHTKSMLGMYLKEYKIFFVSDALASLVQLEGNVPLRFMFKREQYNFRMYLATIWRLRRFCEENPDIIIAPAADIPKELADFEVPCTKYSGLCPE
jgi:glyoxylase-like metal-dependent hydrolase (beta-lactamase superfamily II)